MHRYTIDSGPFCLWNFANVATPYVYSSNNWLHEFKILSTIVFPDAAGEVYGCNGEADYGEYVLSSRSFLSFKFDREAIMKSCFESWSSAVLPLVFKIFPSNLQVDLLRCNLLVVMQCVLDQDYINQKIPFFPHTQMSVSVHLDLECC